MITTEQIIAEKGLTGNQEKIKGLLRQVKVIYSDVDATLLGARSSILLTAEGEYTVKTAQAIVDCLSRGIDITLVSGRSARQLFSDARLLGLSNFIAELGCEIIHNLGEEVILNIGDLEVTERNLHETVIKSGAVDVLHRHFKKYLEFHTPWSDDRSCTPVLRGHINVDEANQLLREKGYGNLRVIDNGIIQRRGTLPPDIAEVHVYHVVPEGAGKARGIRKDMMLRGLNKNEVVAIGDSLSDLEVAGEVGAFFLVRNGLTGKEEVLRCFLECDNSFVTEGKMGLGFAELADSILASKLTS